MLTEQRDDGLRVVVGRVGLVEAVEYLQLRIGSDVDVAQKTALKECLQHRFVALQELADQHFRINSLVVFCLQVIMSSANGHLYI